VAALQLVDGVLKVAPGLDAEDEAVVDQGVGHREAFAATHGAGEEEIAAPDRPLSISNAPSLKQRRKKIRWLMA
jgi:hypothetical protein